MVVLERARFSTQISQRHAHISLPWEQLNFLLARMWTRTRKLRFQGSQVVVDFRISMHSQDIKMMHWQHISLLMTPDTNTITQARPTTSQNQLPLEGCAIVAVEGILMFRLWETMSLFSLMEYHPRWVELQLLLLSSELFLTESTRRESRLGSRLLDLWILLWYFFGYPCFSGEGMADMTKSVRSSRGLPRYYQWE